MRALCATVKELPDGSFGMVLLGVKGNDLLIYDTNMKSEPLKLMHTIPLKGVTDFSTTSLMGEILKGYTFRFTSDGFTYSFKRSVVVYFASKTMERPPSSVP